MIDINKAIISAVEKEEKRKSTLEYQFYLEEFLQCLQADNSGEECTEIVVCPEPIEFIRSFDNLTSVEECRKHMDALRKGFQRVPQRNRKDKEGKRVYEREDGLWLHETAEGINLQPGLINSKVDEAVVLNDDIVHTVVVGRTGSGKSVFLNHLLMTLLHEYAPWELDLYLADFKKVELSRYMTYVPTPHLRTCAATSEIRYVVSMLEHLQKCMLARQNLLAKLGIQKLSDFRRKFDVVLPRVILLVDEFQQMYEDASTKDGDKIRSLIHSIIKLGRATGFHLVFASQEMSGALSGNELANFKARFALNCDGAISSLILGNDAASKIKRGRVIVNTNISADNKASNKEYQVPFIEADNKAFAASSREAEEKEPFFYECLRTLYEKATETGFLKQQIFYQEDLQKDIDTLEEILQKIGQKRREIITGASLYYDVLTLGQGVVYSKKKHDIETVYLERGHNKNIMAVCSDLSDLIYVQQLLAHNFQHREEIKNLYFDLNPLITARYDITREKTFAVEKKREEDFDTVVRISYLKRRAIQAAAYEVNVYDFIQKYYDTLYEQKLISEEAKDIICAKLKQDVKEMKEEEVYRFCSEHSNNEYCYLIDCYHKYKVEGKNWNEIFPPVNIWISGLEYMDGIPKYLPEIMKRGMEVNILFLLFASGLEAGRETELIKCCDYFFAKGEQEKLYSKFDMNYAQRSRNSIAIDFKIRSLNTERAFKKYRMTENEYEVPSLDFDELLL